VVYVVTISVGVLIGFPVGLIVFKRSNRWCPSCGHTLQCDSCTDRNASR
jgi:NADH pyrophosphatase NudC (nudix superfamily)